jgi:hypothetical protein
MEFLRSFASSGRKGIASKAPLAHTATRTKKYLPTSFLDELSHSSVSAETGMSCRIRTLVKNLARFGSLLADR